MYPDYIMEDVRQSLGYEEDDSTVDKMIYELSKREVFALWLQWQGIIGYEDSILDAVENIYNIDLERR